MSQQTNKMKKILLFGVVFACVTGLTYFNIQSNAQQIVREKTFEISLSSGWVRVKELPQGFDVGFQKALRDGQATFYFNHEIMPPEAGEPPSDTSDMRSQFNSMVRNQYPDARSLQISNPKVNGRILLNAAYDLTDNGVKVRRRYTYFLSGCIAFVVQCSAPPPSWDKALSEFDQMLASLKPGPGGAKEKQILPDDEATSKLKRGLPILTASFPPQWSCEVGNVGIVEAPPRMKRTLEITLAFERKDISAIYRATKLLFRMIKEGKSDANLDCIPIDLQSAATQSSAFIKYVGQVWGCAWGYVANCDPPVEHYRVIIHSSNHKRIGSVTVSREDGAAILTGKVDASQDQRVAAMYHFE